MELIQELLIYGLGALSSNKARGVLVHTVPATVHAIEISGITDCNNSELNGVYMPTNELLLLLYNGIGVYCKKVECLPSASEAALAIMIPNLLS